LLLGGDLSASISQNWPPFVLVAGLLMIGVDVEREGVVLVPLTMTAALLALSAGQRAGLWAGRRWNAGAGHRRSIRYLGVTSP
jgi:hypothetical protein